MSSFLVLANMWLVVYSAYDPDTNYTSFSFIVKYSIINSKMKPVIKCILTESKWIWYIK